MIAKPILIESLPLISHLPYHLKLLSSLFLYGLPLSGASLTEWTISSMHLYASPVALLYVVLIESSLFFVNKALDSPRYTSHRLDRVTLVNESKGL